MADRFAEGNNILIHSLKDNCHLQKKIVPNEWRT